MARSKPSYRREGAEVIALGRGAKEAEPISVELTDSPLADQTLGGFDLAAVVKSIPSSQALLRIAIPDPLRSGIAPESVRIFRVADAGAAVPIWSSGYAPGVGRVWATIREPGTYVPIGLPRDRLLETALRQTAVERRLGPVEDSQERTAMGSLATLFDGPAEDIAELRRLLSNLELQTATAATPPEALEYGQGGHVKAFRLPGGTDPEAFREKLQSLRVPDDGLPEEALFFPPEPATTTVPPWPLSPDRADWDGVDLDRVGLFDSLIDRLRDLSWLRPYPWPWLRSKNWWMHQHDQRHTGHASGPSDIDRTTVNRMVVHRTLAVDGPIISKPAIVDGSIYVGSGRDGGPGGILYKFDLASGTKEGEFPTSGFAYYSPNGIGGTPAVVGGRVYITGVHGKVYCVDATTMTPTAPHPPAIWETDLDVADSGKNQPVNQPNADCWSGPLVVGDRVFVGCGEGEDANTYGFIYCLDANSGRVRWLFCTAKFGGAGDNAPNVLPAAVAASWAASAGFTVAANPPESGSSVWSSCAYDSTLDRIYVGTGNSQYDFTIPGLGTILPDQKYGSGVISLDAATGAFRGFFQPAPDDSYWPGDLDIDVPGAPTVVRRGTDRVVAFGSKNGSFFLLDPDTLAPLARRQMLPRAGGSGVPGDRGTGVSGVVPGPGFAENKYGIFGTPAVHPGSGRLFFGLGGYNGMALDAGAGIDPTRTPFIRAVDWNTLADAWPTALSGDGITRYTAARPPLYTSREVGLSSPAVVNDVVFVSTDKAALYALDVASGQCLWAAPNLPTVGRNFALGPAIYGNYVAVGAGPNLYVYRLGWRFFLPPRYYIDPRLRYPWPPPPPPWRDVINPVAEARANQRNAVLLGLAVFGGALLAGLVTIGVASLLR